MSGAQATAAVYFAVGLVRSAFKTSHLRSLVDEPPGGLPRFAVVYLLLVVLWLPVDALFWLHGKLEAST